jgi:hypothetical protein
MTELSPAAKAVLTAVTLTRYDVPPEGLPAFAEEMAPLLAAALRAAADQVVPVENTKAKMFEWQRERLIQRLTTRQALLAIANELNP